MPNSYLSTCLRLSMYVSLDLLKRRARAADSFCLQPTAFLQLHTDDASDPSCRIKINLGTTTLAFIFRGGIVVAVDSRASAGSSICSLRSVPALPAARLK